MTSPSWVGLSPMDRSSSLLGRPFLEGSMEVGHVAGEPVGVAITANQGLIFPVVALAASYAPWQGHP
jgi:hypothetical protein